MFLNADFDAQFEKLRPTLYKHARLAVPSHDAEDLVQDCYVAARQSLHRYDPSLHLGRWLIGILNNLLADLQRKQRRERPASNFANPAAVDYLFESPGAPTFSDLREEVMALLPLAGLSPEQAVAIRLRIDGYTLAQIAKRRNVAHNTISDRIRAGVRLLHACPYNTLARPNIDMYFAKRGQQRIAKYHAPPNLGSALARRSLRQLEMDDVRIAGLIRSRRQALSQRELATAEEGADDEA